MPAIVKDKEQIYVQRNDNVKQENYTKMKDNYVCTKKNVKSFKLQKMCGVWKCLHVYVCVAVFLSFPMENALSTRDLYIGV